MPSPFGPTPSSTPPPQPLPAITSLGRPTRVRGIDIVKLALWALVAAVTLSVPVGRAIVASMPEHARAEAIHLVCSFWPCGR